MLAEGAAQGLGLSHHQCVQLRQAGLLHDLGRVAVSAGVWDKPGQLTRSEWEEVRLHPYHTERILSRSQVLAPVAQLAGMHHERHDGSGYPHHAHGRDMPLAARILAAADAYQAMTQARSYRAALSAELAAQALTGEARTGRLDAECVRAVLAAAGHRTSAVPRAWRAGLSDREVESPSLACYRPDKRPDRGDPGHLATNRRAPRPAHIRPNRRIARAAAALYAMQHGLLGR